MSVLDDSKRILATARDTHGVRRVIVGVSGGKDSVVTLDLCVRAFGASNVHAFFMQFVPGLESVEGPAIAACKRAGVSLTMTPHWAVSHVLRAGTLAPPRPGIEKVRLLKLGDVEARVRKEIGDYWITYGWRAADSITRRVMFKRWGHVWAKPRRFFPIATWRTDEIKGYLRMHKIPIPPRFGSAIDGGPSGFDLSPNCLRYMRDHHLSDYRRVLKLFPFADAQLARERFYPELQGDDDGEETEGGLGG